MRRFGLSLLFLALMSHNLAFAALPDKAPPKTGALQPKRQLKQLTHLPGRLVVKLKAGTKADRLQAIKEKHRLTISEKKLSNRSHRRFKDLYDVVAEKTADLQALAAELKANDAVEYAEPITISYTQSVPNDPLYAQQWSHQKTHAESAWNTTTGTASTIIAVVDTGVSYTHPDLVANIWHDAQGNPGKDFVDIDTTPYLNEGFQLIPGEDYQTPDFDPADYYGHGTHVAGIIAAAGNNGIGVTGVCPQCKIMPLRAGFALTRGGYDYGVLESDAIADAIIYAADNGAKVINMSFGGPESQLEQDAIDYADSKGVVLVAAAGNDGISSTGNAYPAAFTNVLAVAATDNNDARAWYSNYGAWVGVAAPGGDAASFPILSTLPTFGSLSSPSGYGGLSGTSMATPYVAGEAGLILSRNPGLNSSQVKQAIRQGVDVFNVDLPDSPYYLGTGRVNLDKALQVNSFSTSTATVTAPSNDFIVGDSLTVTGSSSAPYSLWYGEGIYPSSWTQFGAGEAGSGVLGNLGIDSLSSPFHDYTIKLMAEDQSGKSEQIVQGRIGKQFLPGWPQRYSFHPYNEPVWNGPTLADLDQDSFDEIIVPGQDSSFRGTINVFKKDGSQAAGWPQHLSNAGDVVPYGVAAGDLNGDGNVDIVASAQGPDALMCWDRSGNLLWSKVLEAGNPSLNVSLADINGDGKLEIITETYQSKLYVLDAAGNVLWSYFLNDYNDWNFGDVAVADFDHDGKKEIVKNVLTKIKQDPGDWTATTGGSLIVFNSDGTVRWKHDWPEPGESLPNYYWIGPRNSPLVADINNDGKLEVMVAVQVWKMNDAYYPTENLTRFYAFDEKGAVLPGWPVTVSGSPATSTLAMGDLDQDGYPELVGGTVDLGGISGMVHAITHTGALLFPSVPVMATNNPAIADVTGDGFPDIVVNDGNAFRVIQRDGSVSTLPITVKSSVTNVNNTPVLTDLDHNGTEDLVFIDWQFPPVLWAWDLQVPHHPAAELYTRPGFDAQHSNYFYPPGQPPLAVATPLALPGGMVGAGYLQTLTAHGGTAPYLWSVAGGALPAGVTLAGSTGLISGTPTVAASYQVTVRVTDAKGSSASKQLTLDITPVAATLGYSRLGTGTGTVAFAPGASCTGNCSPSYPLGTAVTLTATADADSSFTGWGGACTGTGTCTVVIDGNKEVSATFAAQPSIRYNRIGTGSGTVLFTPGTNCTGSCKQIYGAGTQVTLSAVADIASSFAGWGGACTGTGDCTVTVSGLSEVSATFVQNATPFTGAGDYKSLALFGDSTVWSWGGNHSSPYKLAQLPGVKTVSAGRASYLALNKDGTVWAWGDNSYGQLGNGTTTYQGSPIQVPGLSQAVAVSEAGNDGMALKADGTVWTWGSNSQGQVGDGTTIQRTTPVQVPGLSGIVAIASGSGHRVALKSDGTVWSWGANSSGQLGDGTVTQRLAPVQVRGLFGAISIAAGQSHTIALKGDGTVWLWGDNSLAQLGDPSGLSHSVPFQNPQLASAVAIAAGGLHSLALLADGTVWSWGCGSMGQLGDGNTSTRYAATEATGLSGVVSIAGGLYYSLAVRGDGTLWAWGSNAYGELGDLTFTSRSTPVKVTFTSTTPTTTATPPGGAYTVPQTVSLMANKSANVYYTLDGSTPTTSSALYSAPLSINTTKTLKYFARDTKGNNEAVNTQTYTITPQPPVAAFTASATTGNAPLSVTFSDSSTGTPSSWLWDFGDGTTSTQQNPQHVYSSPGSYTVTLTATNAGGSNTKTKGNYISAIDPGPEALQPVYNNAADGATLRMRAGGLTESPLFNRNINVKISGGYDFPYQFQVGATTLYGAVRISQGKVAFDKIILK